MVFKKLITSLFKVLHRYYIDGWPYLVAFIMLIPRISESSLLFLYIFFKTAPDKIYSVDWLVLVFWIIAIAWIFLNRHDQQKKEKAQEKANKDHYDQLQSIFIKAPNFNVFPDARTYFDNTSTLFDSLKFEHILEEFEKGDYSHIEEVQIKLIATLKLTVIFARSYFGVKGSMAANVMIYFENDEFGKDVTDLLTKDNILYYDPSYEENLKGILVLIPKIFTHDTVVAPTIQITCIKIPIYTKPAELYNIEDYHNSDIALPGAPLAFSAGAAVISDTYDSSPFGHLKPEFKAEISNHFKHKLKDVRVVASFKIPLNLNEEQGKSIGIINIDASDPQAFGDKAQYFNTLYTLIYPSLCIFGKYLFLYKKYVAKNLEKALE